MQTPNFAIFGIRVLVYATHHNRLHTHRNRIFLGGYRRGLLQLSPVCEAAGLIIYRSNSTIIPKGPTVDYSPLLSSTRCSFR